MKKILWFFLPGAAISIIILLLAAVSDRASLTAGPSEVKAGSQNAWADDEAWRAKQAYIAWQETGETTAEGKDLIERYYLQNEPHGEYNPLDNQGGPDGFGYRYKDNVSPDTATFAWIELNGDTAATDITFSSRDDGYSPLLPMGFNFPFYGVVQDSFRVITNGNIQFTTSTTTFSNACLPSSSISGPAIFPFWDDLHLDRGGDTLGTDVVRYRRFAGYTVIEFDSVGFYLTTCVGEVLRFEVILYSNGKIKLQYHTMDMVSCAQSATIGIQQAGVSGSNALQYACDAAGIQPASGRAVWFYPTPPLANDYRILSIDSPTSGLLSPGQTVTVAATFQNIGTTTQSSPVKYRFNNGTTVIEMTPVLAQYQSDAHTFAATFTAPSSPGTYTLRVWSDLATDQNRANDTLSMQLNVRACPDFTINAPGSVSGSTCGAGNMCNLRSSQDRVVRVNIPTTGDWTFSICRPDTTNVWDSYIYLTTDCCGGTTIATDDDGCPETGVGLSVITCQPLTAGTYYVDVEAFSSSVCSTFVLNVTQCGVQTPPNPDSLWAYIAPVAPAGVNLPNRGINLGWTAGTASSPAAYYLYQAPLGGTEDPPSELAGAVEWAAEEGAPELYVGVNMNTGEFRNNRYEVTASNDLPPQSAELVIDPNVSTGTLNVPAGVTVIAFRFVWQSGPYSATSNYTWLNTATDASRFTGDVGAWSDRKRVANQISSRHQYWTVANTTTGCIQLTSRFYDANGTFLVQVSRTICFP